MHFMLHEKDFSNNDIYVYGSVCRWIVNTLMYMKPSIGVAHLVSQACCEGSSCVPIDITSSVSVGTRDGTIQAPRVSMYHVQSITILRYITA